MVLIFLSWALYMGTISLDKKGIPVKFKYGEVAIAVLWMMFTGFILVCHFDITHPFIKIALKSFGGFEYNHFKLIDIIRSVPGGDLHGTRIGLGQTAVS